MIKLGDFGIAKVLSHTVEKARTQVGTPYYLSPEIIENRPYSFKSDVWSIGVVLYELCALRPPFDGSSIHQLSCNIVRGKYSPLSGSFSRDLKTMIDSMLSLDPNKRPTLAQILKMPFVKTRIQSFLSESIRLQEFSHTILHNQNVFIQKNEDAIKKAKEIQQKKENVKKEMLDRNRDMPKEKKPELLQRNELKYELPLRNEAARYEVPQRNDVAKYEIPQRPIEQPIPKQPDPKPIEIKNDAKMFDIPP